MYNRYNNLVTYESRRRTEKRFGTMIRRRSLQFKILRHRFPAHKSFLEYCIRLKQKRRIDER